MKKEKLPEIDEREEKKEGDLRYKKRRPEYKAELEETNKGNVVMDIQNMLFLICRCACTQVHV